MIPAILNVITLIVIFLEALGFFAIRQYFIILGIPLHFTSLQLFELPGYGFDLLTFVLSVAPIPFLILFCVVALLAVILTVIVSTQRTMRDVAYIQAENTLDIFGRFANLFQDWTRPLTAILSVLLLFSLLFGLIISDAWTSRRVNDVLTGSSFGLITEAKGRDSVEIIFIKDATIPKGISSENSHGALTLLWQDEKAYYVSPVHRTDHVLRPNIKHDAEYFPDWFAVERSQVLALKHNRQADVDSVLTAARKGSQTFSWYSLVPVLLTIVAVAVIGKFKKPQQSMEMKALPLNADYIESLELPTRTWQAILLAFGRGQDCILEYRTKNVTQSGWLRRELFPVGLRLTANHKIEELDHQADTAPSAKPNTGRPSGWRTPSTRI